MASLKYNWNIPWLKEQYEILGRSIYDIGKELNVDQRLVYYHLKKNGVIFKNTGDITKENSKLFFLKVTPQITDDRLNGMTVTELQKKYSGAGKDRISELCKSLPPLIREYVKPEYTEEYRKIQSDNAKEQYKNMSEEKRVEFIAASRESKLGTKNNNYGKVWGGKGRGTRIYGFDSAGNKICFRSTWEDKFSKYLNLNGYSWTYETVTISCGELGTYTPDFYIKEWECFVEVKGWLTDKAYAKIKWFRENDDRSLILATRDVLRNQYGLEIR